MIKESRSAAEALSNGTMVEEGADSAQHPLFTEAMETFRARLLDSSSNPELLLATAGISGAPAFHEISIHNIDRSGIQFFVNGQSRHGRHLQQNRQAALSCKLKGNGELLIVEGNVEALDRSLLKKWWDTRPREEQLLAWASNQSAPLDNLSTLEKRIAQCRMQFVDGAMPPPPHWMGFRLIANRFEFSRPAQRHLTERLCYTFTGNGWTRSLLNP